MAQAVRDPLRRIDGDSTESARLARMAAGRNRHRQHRDRASDVVPNLCREADQIVIIANWAAVEPLGRNADSLALVQAIVTLGRALGMTLLAEGIETEEQRVLLRLAGCEEMQGYLFARPAPREALDRLLATVSEGPSRPLVRTAVA